MSGLDLKWMSGILRSHLPWSPMDFIRGISVEGDRGLFVDTLTREIPDEDDLRLIHEANGMTLGVFCERLPWDSAFFGYDVAKLWGVFPLEPPEFRFDLDYSGAIEALLSLARERGIRYLFTTIDPRDLSTLRALGEAGFSLIETRVYYDKDITDYTWQERFPVRVATPDDIPSLGWAAQVMVNPFDRFHADPFIGSEDADRLMYKWVEASILEGFADITIVPDAPNPSAFCTVRFHQDKWSEWGRNIFQVMLTAVSPEFKGWFRKILSEVHYYMREKMGAEHALYGTQITNKPVIWVLESLGYKFGKCQHVLRKII